VSLADRLRAPGPEDRLAAIAEVATRRDADPAEVEALVEWLGHARKAVQRRAAEALAGLEAPGVAEEIRAQLGAADARLRWGAAWALALRGPLPVEALPVVIESLGADDGDLRWAAAGLVVRLGPEAHVVPALSALTASGSPAQRKMALYCLRDLGVRAPDLDRVVVRALADPDRDVRLAAMSALARLTTDAPRAAACLVDALATGDDRVRRAAAAALGALGERSPAVLAALEQAAAAPDPALHRAVVGALRRLGRGRPD